MRDSPVDPAQANEPEETNEAATKAASADRKAVRDALAGIKDFDTVLGSFSFTPGRDADHTPVVQTVKDGKFVQY